MPEMSIAQEVLGITDRTNVAQSMEQGYYAITGVPKPYDSIMAEQMYLNITRTSTPHRFTSAMDQREDAIHDISDILRNDINASSPLTSWHTYRYAMDAYGTRRDGSARALLLGALNGFSAVGFPALARRELGADQAYIVDLVAGPDKARHGHFLQGDALRLPLASGSMDFVITDQLLHMLKDPASPSTSVRQRLYRLCGEIGRLLAPGGQLILHEANPAFSGKEPTISEALHAWPSFAQLVMRGLQRFDFQHIQVEMGVRRGGYAYWFDPEPDFSRIGLDRVLSVLAYARLPERQVHVTSPIIALGATAAYTSGAVEGTR